MPNDETHTYDPETPDLEFLVNHVNEDTDQIYLLVLEPQSPQPDAAFNTVHCGRCTVLEGYTMARDSRVDWFYVQPTESDTDQELPPYELTIVLKFNAR